jgi:alpha-amylase
MMLDLINKHPGKFKLSYSISGIALDQFELYAPEVIDSFRELAATGQVEFLSETYAHSLASLKNKEEFRRQITEHKDKIKELFNYEPVVFRNTELIYSDEIGAIISEMGYKGILSEGAKHVLGWKSPNFVYTNAINPRLKVLLKNFKLSDDIAFRFSNRSWSDFPLTAEKFVGWLKDLDKNEDTVNLFMDYETFGEHQWAETGIFEFIKALPSAVFKRTKFSFATPSEIIEEHQPVGVVSVPYPTSWADEERDLTAWLGNPLQEQAYNKLYDMLERVNRSNDRILKKDYKYLQVSDHFYYMCTKFFSDGDVHSYFNPYNSPYEAFINYMNILSDFEIRLNAAVTEGVDSEVSRLSKLINEKDDQIKKIEKQLQSVQSGILEKSGRSATIADSLKPEKKTSVNEKKPVKISNKASSKTSANSSVKNGVKKTVGSKKKALNK